jgi:hypothetical protein
MYDANAEPADDAGETVVLRPVRDLGGLDVDDSTGIPVGKLFGSLIEADTGLVRYVDLELATLNRHVLVPIGHARVRDEKTGHSIRLRAALLEDLEQIPPFPTDLSHVDDPFERALLEAYGRTFHGERYYAHPAYDHDGLYVGEHPVVGTGEPADETLIRLAYLPGWRIAEGEPDIRGWPLVLEQDRSLTVRDLIVQPSAEKVRYVVLAGPADDVARLLPVGFLSVDAAAQLVWAPGLTAEDVAALPAYDGGGVHREQEDRLNTVLRRRLNGRRRYALPDYRTGRG